MTVEELKAELEEWPNDMEVWLGFGAKEWPIGQIVYAVDLDGNNRRLILDEYPSSKKDKT